ncbi:MAG TPA: type II toxin-antitoxin system MqsA family antitoxin [Thermoanaerobaculia bacterium]|nr:type II toxin-antitoxin system MqsA family antitoxin [Thermoanaerobaculia bacterium]
MKCRVCSGKMKRTTTDLPFKTSERTIVILKGLPVLQCDRCSEYAIADATFKRVEAILAQVDSNAELEIIRFAA